MTHAPLQSLLELPAIHDRGARAGLTSVCSAHPIVIEAALRQAADDDAIALIEATCNQVNQDGGYTGMTPLDFRAFVLRIAEDVSFPADRILFGGDHLGPNPWRDQPAEQAMAKAVEMTQAYAAAGFSKIHLDASMACADDPDPLPAATVAARAAVLASAAEQGAASGNHPQPAYIIGTEVPVPGGADHALDSLQVTSASDTQATLDLHRAAFDSADLADAYARVIGVVVQPGVEFGHENVIPFAPAAARDLSQWRAQTGGVVFEAHSTDYQTTDGLGALVDGGFAILKVGPGLSFAMREAFYGLDQIAGILVDGYAPGTLPQAMDATMLAAPKDWQGYYHGDAVQQQVQRHFSYSDRIRYYWGHDSAKQAVDVLFQALDGVDIPETLISQYLPRQYPDVLSGNLAATPHSLSVAAVRTALNPYSNACKLR